MHWKLFIVGVLLGSLAFQTLPTTAEQRDALPVTFVTQFDGSAFAQTNCGPASVTMAINFATGQKLTPLQVRQAIAKLPGGGYAANTASGTAIQDLARIARAHNVEVFSGDGAASVGWGSERIRRHLEQGHPVIVLTRLAHLPGYSPTSQIDHYILLIGATASGYIYHDSGQSTGARRTISDRQLQLAMKSSGVPGQGIALAGPKGSKPAASAALPTPDVVTVKYTVARGDTVSQLAQRHGISQQQLLALNAGVVRNVNHIEVGQVLTLPETIKPSAAPTQPAKPSPSADAAQAPPKPSPTAAASTEPAKPMATTAPRQPPKPTPAPTRATEQQRRAN